MDSSPQPTVEETVAVLRSLLQDEQEEIRRTAAESLGKIGNQMGLAALFPLIRDPSPLVRSSAIKAIGRLGSSRMEEAVTAVLPAFTDESELVRRSAVEAVGELDPSPAALSSLIQLLDSSDVRTRKAVLLALLSTDTSPWVEVLNKALQDGDGEIRRRAVAVLGENGSLVTRIQLRATVLRDPDPAVRIEAVYRLRHAPDEEIRTVLRRVAVEDQDGDVRRWAKE